jgi:hypothetical protein
MMSFKKLLKYWRTPDGLSSVNTELQIMDVTALRCEEDHDALQLVDDNDRVIAEFGPGKTYDGWLLTVEYAPRKQRRYGEIPSSLGHPSGSLEWQRA